MKISITLSFILIAATFNNQSSAVAGNNTLSTSAPEKMNDTATISGRWVLVPVLSSDTVGGKIPEISFDLTTHKFNGNSGCNSMSGSFELKNDEIKFNEQIISTKMACPGYNEKVFMDNLLKVNRYEIKESVLSLIYNATPLFKWSRHIDTEPVKSI